MKKDRLIDAIGHIDDELLRETDDIRKQYFNVGSKRKKRRNNILSILAACILLVLLVGIGVAVSSNKKDDDNYNAGYVGVLRDYIQKVEVSIVSWQPWGCIGTIVDACNHDVFKENDMVCIKFNENIDGTKVIYKDGSCMLFDSEELDMSNCELKSGSIIEVEFYGFGSDSWDNNSENVIYACTVQEK